MTDGASSPHAGTADHYAAHRPGYGEAAIEYLVDRFDLSDARVLDLGCGPGTLAVPLAAHTGSIVAMDPDEAMLARAREHAQEAGRENLAFRSGSDAELHDVMGPFRLTTMGRSFHWMDGRKTIRQLRAITEPAGGVAILNDHGLLTRGTEDWTAAVHTVVSEYADVPEQRDPAEVEYDDPWDELLADCGLVDVETTTFPLEREWTVDGVVGYLLSLSSCAPAVLGDDREELAEAVREVLIERGGGPFQRSTAVEVLTGRWHADEEP